jgi:hypothetical protein
MKTNDGFIEEAHSDDICVHLDSVWVRAAAALQAAQRTSAARLAQNDVDDVTKAPHMCTTPLVIEPVRARTWSRRARPLGAQGLQSLCWPLTADEFMETVYQKRCLAVQGTAERLSGLQKVRPTARTPARMLA